MHDNGSEQYAKYPSKGLLRPGRFFWARALPWSLVLGIALWIAYKFVQDVGVDLGLGRSGVATMLGVLAALALYVLGVLLIERRVPDELGLAKLAPELAAGVVLGAALFSVMMTALLTTGAYVLTGPTATVPWRALMESFEGAVEEVIFRGAIFRLLWALGLSSALFGAMHLPKPGADLMAVLGVISGGGVPLAALYLLTGRLWASIGYHIAWNFTEAYVFGAQISGSGFGASLYQVRPATGVGTLWTGDPFGPEASVANVVVGLLAGAALLALAKRSSGNRSRP